MKSYLKSRDETIKILLAETNFINHKLTFNTNFKENIECLEHGKLDLKLNLPREITCERVV